MEKLVLTDKDIDYIAEEFMQFISKRPGGEVFLFTEHMCSFHKKHINVSDLIRMYYTKYSSFDSIQSVARAIITYAFSWPDSHEGYDFWQDVNFEWMDYVEFIQFK